VSADPFDLVRKWFEAFNAADLDALTALYHDEASIDAGGEVVRGRDAVGRELQALLQRSANRTVRTIARVETGAMHAEWRGLERAPGRKDHDDTAGLSTSAGYDDFWVELGLIRSQRTVLHPLSFQAAEEPPPVTGERPSRQYPAQPIVGVGAVIVDQGQVVLVKRKYEPLAGQWSLPGGRLELGETLEAGLAREMVEETGLVVEVGPVVEVFDRILLDPERRVRYHYVLIDYLCRPVGGVLMHGSDVAAAELVNPGDLERFRLTPKATAVIEKAFNIARTHTWRTDGR
jgi:8-oxo-dGTP diphosphatase